MTDNELAARIVRAVTERIIEPAEPEQRVIFRRFRAEPRDVIAFFPDQDEGRGLIGSYMHVGQHSPAQYPNDATEPADESEPDVAALKRELEGIGYRLRVVRRRARP